MSCVSYKLLNFYTKLLYQLCFFNFAVKRENQSDYDKNMAWIQYIQPLGWHSQHVTIFIGMKCTKFTIHKKNKKIKNK